VINQLPTRMRQFLPVLCVLVSLVIDCQALDVDGGNLPPLADMANGDTATVHRLFELYEKTINSDNELAKAYSLQALKLSKSLNYMLGEAVALKNIGALNQYYGKYDSARYYYIEAGTLFTILGDSSQLISVKANSAASYYDQGKYSEALAELDSVRSLLKEKDYGYINAFADNTTGSIYMFRGYYQLATRYKASAIAYYSENGEEQRKADAEKDLALIYSESGNDSMAFELFYSSCSIYKKYSDMRFLGDAYLNMGVLFTEKSNYDSALHYLTMGLELADSTAFSSLLGTGEESMAYLYMKKGLYTEALRHLEKALEIAKQSEDHRSQASIHLNFADVFLELRRTQEAKEHLDKAYALAGEMNSLDLLKIYYYMSYKTYQQTGNATRALEAYVNYSAYKDSLNTLALQSQLAEMELLHGIELSKQLIKDQEARILLLKKDNRIQRQKMSILSGGILFTVMLAAFVVFIIRLRFIRARAISRIKMREQQRELEYKRRELASYTLHLAQKNRLLEELQEDIDDLRSGRDNGNVLNVLKSKVSYRIQIDRDWKAFKRHFEAVHPSFFTSLMQQHPGLSVNDLRLLALMKMNMSSKEIATVLNITPDSLKKSRYRLRRKMGLADEQNLSDYLV